MPRGRRRLRSSRRPSWPVKPHFRPAISIEATRDRRFFPRLAVPPIFGLDATHRAVGIGAFSALSHPPSSPRTRPDQSAFGRSGPRLRWNALQFMDERVFFTRTGFHFAENALGRACFAPSWRSGEVAEWLNAPHSKCGIGASLSGVRIPPSPPMLSSAIVRHWLHKIAGVLEKPC